MPHHKPPLDPNQLEFARLLRHEATDAEAQLWHHLRGRQMAGRKFRRQHPLPPYVLDFYCEELCLGIELDGGQHYSAEGRELDRRRAEHLARMGVRLLRFSNREVLLELPAVLERIYGVITAPSPYAGRPSPLLEGEGKSGW
ncbi:endonuclease domain-containing protein [Pseudomonas sp. CAU 1711]|uniref:endonuclease domain-containing protein n=1 Tax=Pseudomonas sp. CAU 1711 TaxID=3140356 RepID=UPI0032607C62